MPKDYYKVLNIDSSASQEEIKKSFRVLAQKYHPDKSGGDGEKFKEINEAYQTLSDPQKRKMYDQYGSAFEQAQSHGNMGGFEGFRDWAAWAQANQGAQSNQANMGGFDFSNLGDIFGDFFGGNRSAHSSSQQGRDIEVILEVDFKEAALGVEKEISLDKYIVCPSCKGSGAKEGSDLKTCPRCHGKGKTINQHSTFLGTFQSVGICPDCQGRGQVIKEKCDQCRGNGRIKETSKIKIKIPAGINNGQTIRMSGQGEAGLRGDSSGSLYITIKVRQSSFFQRDGYNLLSIEKISISQALLGDKISVKNLDSQVKLKIPSGTISGQQFRLKGKGIKKLHSRGNGDQIVTIKIEIPQKLNKEQKELIQKLEKLGL